MLKKKEIIDFTLLQKRTLQAKKEVDFSLPKEEPKSRESNLDFLDSLANSSANEAIEKSPSEDLLKMQINEMEIKIEDAEFKIQQLNDKIKEIDFKLRGTS